LKPDHAENGVPASGYQPANFDGAIHSSTVAVGSADFVPSFPTPRRRLPNHAGTIYGLYKNPISLLTEAHYTRKIVVDRMFGLRAVSLSDPDHIHQVFVANRHKYGIDPIRKLLLSRGFRKGMAVVEGQEWNEIRRVAATGFSNKRLRSYATEMSTIVAGFCRRQPHRQSVSLSRIVTEIAIENAMKCLFSTSSCQSFDRIMETNTGYLEHGMALDVMDIMRMPVDLPRILKKSVGKIARRHRRIVEALYQSRTGLIESGGAPDDLLTRICRHFTQKQGTGKHCPAALDNIGTMLGASYDTTSKTISWAVYLLSKSPEALATLRSEIDTGRHDHLAPHEWPDALPNVLAAVRETLRLYPAIPGMVRYALENDTVGSQPIKKGDYVVASIWLLHRTSRNWTDGARFKIARFLPGGEASMKAEHYMPFGLGPRTCIGHRFAELESVIVLATLLRHFDFEYAAADPPIPVWKGTLRSSNGIPVTMIRRA
jgi:cytochrome P450